MRIVADAAIPYLDLILDRSVTIERIPGAEIDAAALAHADALLVRSVTRVDDTLLARSSLRFVGSATAGTDHVDTDALRRCGVSFGHAPGCNAPAVVHYVLTAIHHLAAHHDPDLFERPIGVVGFGHVGRRLTQTLRAMGMSVLVTDPPLAATGRSREQFVELERILERCGVVTLHVPLTQAADSDHPTRHLLDATRVRRLMRGRATLINTSRGGVIDETPLLDSPRCDGHAILDVWESEPSLAWNLLAASSPVVVATPHVAGYSVEGKREATRLVVQSMAEHLDLRVSALPASAVADSILIADPQLTPTSAVADVFMRSCDLAADDRALRHMLRLPAPTRASAFEALRSRYRLRREPSAWRVHATDPTVRGRLAAAGFRIQ